MSRSTHGKNHGKKTKGVCNRQTSSSRRSHKLSRDHRSPTVSTCVRASKRRGVRASPCKKRHGASRFKCRSGARQASAINAHHQQASKSRSQKSKRRPRRTSTSHKSARRVKRSLPPKTRIAVAVTPLRQPSSRPSLHGGSGRTNKKDYVAAALGVTALGATTWYLNKQKTDQINAVKQKTDQINAVEKKTDQINAVEEKNDQMNAVDQKNDQKNAVEQTIKNLYARMLTAGFLILVELCVNLWTLLQKKPHFSTAIQNYCDVLSHYVQVNLNSVIQHEIYMIHRRDLVLEQVINGENMGLIYRLRQTAIKDLPHLARIGMLSTISPQMADAIKKELNFWDKVENENFKTQLIATEWDSDVALMLLRDIAVMQLRETKNKTPISEELQTAIGTLIEYIQSDHINTQIKVYNAYVSCLEIFFLSHLSAACQLNVYLDYQYNFDGANLYQLISKMYKHLSPQSSSNKLTSLRLKK